jgi:hypothetical protein
MIENSAAGLVMVLGEVAVTVTREEHHQPALARYRVAPGVQRRVAVELVWCAIRTGKYRGQGAIEVRLDGQRVGELTHAMSSRYAPLLTQVAAGGGRPGCEAVVERSTRGLEITLRLPRAAEAAVTAAAPVQGAAPRGGLFSSHRPAWIAAAIVVIVFFAAMAGTDDEPAQPSTAADYPVSTTTTTTTTPPATTTTTPAAPKAAPKPVAPKPKPVVPKPAAPKPVVPAPAPPASTCDPNYGGCVPVASDVDCAGGSGNGPAYATGPVDVIGDDVYDLDRDADGVACE